MKPINLLFKNLKSDIAVIYGDESGFRLSAFFHPSFQLTFFYRMAYFFDSINLTFFAKLFCFFNRFFSGCDVHYRAKINGGVLFPHAKCIVIGEGVAIAKNCSIFQQTTIGATEHQMGFPNLGEGVNVYPGSVIAGGVVVGEYSRIGPNVYLTESVPTHTRISPAPYREKRNI